MRLAWVLPLLALATPALAQGSAQGSAMTRDYVAAAGGSDAFEIAEAQTVLAGSGDAQVRSFAQAMIADHMRLGQALRQATDQAGLAPPPMVVDAGVAPMLGALQSLPAADIPHAYWQQQALAHRSALTTTQQYAANGDDPAIRQAAAAALPVIAAHLAMAERMAATAP